jgi:hypothetical protein
MTPMMGSDRVEVWGAARMALLVVHGLSFFLCTVLMPLSTPPSKAERDLRASTRQRWGAGLEWLIVALQHLTVCSLGLLVVYLILMVTGGAGADAAAAQLVAVLMPLQTVVGVLYWSLVLHDPWLLFPRENFPQQPEVAADVIRRLTRVPTLRNPQLLFFWMLMHEQHTLAPAHLWLEAGAGLLPKPASSVMSECACATIVGFSYLAWNFSCWHMRGVAPYPGTIRRNRPPPHTARAAAAACLCPQLGTQPPYRYYHHHGHDYSTLRAGGTCLQFSIGSSLRVPQPLCSFMVGAWYCSLLLPWLPTGFACDIAGRDYGDRMTVRASPSTR